MKFAADAERVRRTIEEVGVAEGDVPRTGCYLAAGVCEHQLARHDR